MTSEPDDRNIVEHAKRTLDASLEELTPSTLAALQRARHQAIRSGTVQPSWSPVWVGGVATAAVAVLAMTLWLLSPLGTKHGSGLEEVEIAGTLEAAEIVDDLEFYEWLVDATERTS